jgi:hypothetical protein
MSLAYSTLSLPLFTGTSELEALDALDQFHANHLVLFEDVEAPGISAAFTKYATSGSADSGATRGEQDTTTSWRDEATRGRHSEKTTRGQDGSVTATRGRDGGATRGRDGGATTVTIPERHHSIKIRSTVAYSLFFLISAASCKCRFIAVLFLLATQKVCSLCFRFSACTLTQKMSFGKSWYDLRVILNWLGSIVSAIPL